MITSPQKQAIREFAHFLEQSITDWDDRVEALRLLISEADFCEHCGRTMHKAEGDTICHCNNGE